jgi:4'-phosphopantetheinyl transferase EntD
MNFFGNIEKTLREDGIHFAYARSAKSPRLLYPAERRFVKGAIAGRREDFASGRWCARKAMASMGIKPGPVLQDREGRPVWPKGLCGSITHTSGACCSVLAYRKGHLSLGLDLERRGRMISPGAAKIILNPDEAAWIGKSAMSRSFLVKLVFCAKESVFKLLHPLTGRRFYFSDVSILKPCGKREFRFKLKRDLRKGRIMRGTYFTDKEWVLALASLPVRAERR